MQENHQRFLEVAFAAVRKAEPIFVKHFGKASGVSLKEGQAPSLVSDADREIEKLLTKEISRHFPGHAIVGEEFPAVKKKDKASKGRSHGASASETFREAEFTWYLDPIDGTTNYIHGFAHCVISVGLWDADGPLAGVVSDPLNRAVYYAARGSGAFKNGKRISVSAREALKDCLGTVGWRSNEPETGVDLLRRMAPRAYRLRVLSSSALELCLVAEGALDFFANRRLSPWDFAAGALVLTEAGGAASDWEGKQLTAHSLPLAASNGKFHQKLLAALS